MRRLLLAVLPALMPVAGQAASPAPELSPLGQSLRPVAPEMALRLPGWHVWCGTGVKDPQGRYHLFYSRWPKSTTYNGWVTHSEIAHAVAAGPTGPFTPVDIALPARGATFWDGLCTHNPTVHAFDGKYYLYYMGNTGDGRVSPGFNYTHRNRQRIGVAVADHPDGPWTRSDQPVLDVSADPAAPDSLCVTNPAVCRMKDGRYLMIYKAVGRDMPLPFGGPVVHLAAIAARPEGPFVKQPGKIFDVPGKRFPAEDPYVWHDGTRYRAVVKDMSGDFTQAGVSLAEFASDDGLHWAPTKPCLVCTRQFAEKGRDTPRRVDRLERPQLLLENGRPVALYLAVLDGAETWNVHVPLAPPADTARP